MRIFRAEFWAIFLKANLRNLLKIIVTYSIPIINILIVIGIINGFNNYSAILGVTLGANAAFLAAISIDFSKLKQTWAVTITYIVLIVSSVVPFTVITIEQTSVNKFMNPMWYSSLVISGAIIAIILSSIACFLETQKDEHIRFSNESQYEKSYSEDGKTIKL